MGAVCLPYRESLRIKGRNHERAKEKERERGKKKRERECVINGWLW